MLTLVVVFWLCLAVFLQALSIKILLYKCGIQNLPDFDDWWCKNKCCCIHEGITCAAAWRST